MKCKIGRKQFCISNRVLSELPENVAEGAQRNDVNLPAAGQAKERDSVGGGYRKGVRNYGNRVQ